MIFGFTIPAFRLPSQINQHGSWQAKSHAVKKQRTRVALEWLAIPRATREELLPPFVVTLTRIGPVKIDSDNVVSSLKHVRDELAHQLEVDDGDESRIVFEYQQEKGPFAVRFRIHSEVGLS